MQQIIKEASYVCEPPSLKIVTKYKLYNESGFRGTGVKVSFYEHRALVFHKDILTKRSFFEREEYDKLLKQVLNTIFNMDRNDFQKHSLKNEIKGLFFYDNLTCVKAKSGKIIFKR